MNDFETGTTDGQTPDKRLDLKHLCEIGFEGDVAATALALGRETEQISDMIAGSTVIDEDLEMKLYGIAEERGISM